MTQPGRRIERLRELLFLATHHMDGAAGIAGLLTCYAAILRDPMDTSPVKLAVRHLGRRLELHVRKSDIFTVAELFRERQYALSRPLGPAPRIVDAGANVGVAGAWFLLQHPGAHLLAVEPASDNFTFLEATLGRMPNVVLAKVALSDHDGLLELALADHGAEHSVHATPGMAGSERVTCRRLDRLLDEIGFDKVDLLKLDVEGSEIEVLLGLGEHLARVGAIVGEVHERLIDVDLFYDLLARNGFTVVRREYYSEGKICGVHTVEAWRR